MRDIFRITKRVKMMDVLGKKFREKEKKKKKFNLNNVFFSFFFVLYKIHFVWG